MSASTMTDLHYKSVIFENSPKIAWALRQVQIERITNITSSVNPY